MEYNYKEINRIAAEIAKNNSDEQGAIQGYYQFLSETEGLPPKFLADIREIISDEMNHSEKLSYWVTYFTGIKPAKD
jgi:rubrerythrin